MRNRQGFYRDFGILLDWRICHTEKGARARFNKLLDELFIDYDIKRLRRKR